MDTTLEEVRQELTDIHDELSSLPSDAYDRRAELKQRQIELRQLSAQLVEGEPLHDRAALQAAYERLQDVRDRLLDQHLSYSSTSVGDAGVDSQFTGAVNKAIDAGLGIDEIERRLGEILGQMSRSR